MTSSHFDVLVRGGTVVSDTGSSVADLGVRDGKIAACGEHLTGDAELVIDARGKLVLPGLIDVHTHPVYADDMASMTRAGAAGGVTTVFPFVGAFPSWGFPKTSTSEVVLDFIDTWNEQVSCDFGIHAAFDSVDDIAAEVPQLVGAGVTSFKFFMAYRARGMMVDDDCLVRGMSVIGKAGALAMVHAENGSGIEWLESESWDKSDVDRREYLRCHTSLFESEAVLRAIALADAVDCPLYLPHVTVAEGLAAAELGRSASGSPVWLETCPHYLVLTNDEVLRRGALSKIAPPIRYEKDSEKLWAGLADGRIEVMATDHCGRTVAMKEDAVNILQAPYGSEGIEHLLQLAYTEGVLAGRMTVEQLTTVCSKNPAEIFGLSASKGSLEVGKDADVVVFDPSTRSQCSAELHRGASDYCLYEGREVAGSVEVTMLRGEVVFAEGELSKPSGRFLACDTWRAPTGQ